MSNRIAREPEADVLKRHNDEAKKLRALIERLTDHHAAATKSKNEAAAADYHLGLCLAASKLDQVERWIELRMHREAA